MNKISRELNKTIDSREVAEMLGKEHWMVLRDIEGSKDGKTIGIIQVLADNKLGVSDYFVESSYKDNSGKANKCYQVTKMGCEMLGNKQQGEKGILFTARYVKRFNEMENYIENKVPILSTEEILELQYKYTREVKEEVKELKEDFNDFRDNAPLFNIECEELMDKVKSVATRELGGYKSPAYNDKSLRGRIYADIQIQLRREFGVKKYKAIKRSQLNKAKEVITNYKAPTVLLDEIVQANNQICFKEVM
ncbi:MAG: ORF6C domain-containing protein [Clostridium sp.]